MSAHRPHTETRDANGFPLLFDDCPRCDEQAGELGIHLDTEKWPLAWQMMLRVEIYDQGAYLSYADKKLGRGLYVMFLVLQRNTVVNPEALLHGPLMTMPVEIPADVLVLDPYRLRLEAERLIGEDRVPTDVLREIVANYDDQPEGVR